MVLYPELTLNVAMFASLNLHRAVSDPCHIPKAGSQTRQGFGENLRQFPLYLGRDWWEDLVRHSRCDQLHWFRLDQIWGFQYSMINTLENQLARTDANI